MNKKQSYNKLKNEWYAKLKAEGFKDIEDSKGNLTSWSNMYTLDRYVHGHGGLEFRETYYRLAEHFLNQYQFSNEVERIIWEYHSNGISVRNIVNTLRKAKVSTLGRNSVWTIINRLETEMKRRYLAGVNEEQ